MKWPWIRRREYNALEKRYLAQGEHMVAAIIRLKERLAQSAAPHHHGGDHCANCGRWLEKAPKKHVCPMFKRATTSTTAASPGKVQYFPGPPILPGPYKPTFHSRVSFPKNDLTLKEGL